jgi:site-specific DNA recombinase
MKAAIYCRVSTEDQEREGTSLQSQLDACLRLAQEKCYQVEECYIIQEVYSGLTLDRPDLARLRGWLDTGEVNAVIVYDSDRFSRDGYDFVTLVRDCQKANVELLCVTEPIEHGPIGELLSYVRGWASRREAEKIRERTTRGKVARAKSGRLLGGTGSKLYGYNYMPGKGVGEGKRYVNEEQAKWVREMFRWLVEEGLTVNGIVFWIMGFGSSSPSGSGDWGKSTVHKILRNPAYIGRTYAFTQTRIEAKRHNKANRKNKATHVIFKTADQWVEIPDATPPIISEELFNQAQEKLQRNREQASRNAKERYLLSSYVFCRHCSRRYSGWRQTYKTKNGVVCRRHYKCPGTAKIVSPTPCRNRIVNADYLEEVVWQQIKDLLCKPEIVLIGLGVKENEAANANSYQVELEGLEAQFRQTKREKDRVWKAFKLTGDEAKFAEEIKEVTDKTEELTRRRLELEKRIEASEQAETDIEGIKRFCELAKRNLSEFTFEDKRLALEALRIKVWIDNEQITVEGAIPEVDTTIESTTLWHSRQCWHRQE